MKILILFWFVKKSSSNGIYIKIKICAFQEVEHGLVQIVNKIRITDQFIYTLTREMIVL